jgi:hypothetical protein
MKRKKGYGIPERVLPRIRSTLFQDRRKGARQTVCGRK